MSGASGSGTSHSEMHESGLPLASIQNKDAKISVWIDLENCGIPGHESGAKVSSHIVDALRRLGYHSSNISITAYASIDCVSQHHQIALQQTGITLSPIFHTGPYALAHIMLAGFGSWAFVNLPPANLLIISGDVGFWPTMNTLKNNGYNVMMACRPESYRSAPPANTVMCWNNLVVGILSPAQIIYL